MTEHDIQNLIRLEFSRNYPNSLLFRANIGQAWIGSHVKHNPDGSLTIYDPRPFLTGLPNGFSDLFGVLPGGRALFVEVKTDKGKPSEAQVNFLRHVSGVGALAGIARSFEDVTKIINGG
jgi:VRR-NUC domain.